MKERNISKRKLAALMQTSRTQVDRVLDPVSRCLTPEAAQRLIELRADPDLQARVDLLANMNTEGQLTPEEREEYALCVRASHFIAILQSKARKLLAQRPSA